MARSRGSSKAGRPRKSGDRYSDGRLKPIKGNPSVEQRRRDMLNDDSLDISTASDPLDFAHAKGFLTTARYRTAGTYLALHRQANPHGPRMGNGSLAETMPTTNVREGAFSTLSHAEVTQIFDAVFNVGAPPAEDAATKATKKWQKVQKALTPDERNELHATVVNHSCPMWLIILSNGGDPGSWARKRVWLETGLDKVRRALATERPRQEQTKAQRPIAELIDFHPGEEADFIEDGRRKRVVILSERTNDLGEPTRVVEFLNGEEGEFDVKEKLLQPLAMAS
jgi:hypothetical protein